MWRKLKWCDDQKQIKFYLLIVLNVVFFSKKRREKIHQLKILIWKKQLFETSCSLFSHFTLSKWEYSLYLHYLFQKSFFSSLSEQPNFCNLIRKCFISLIRKLSNFTILYSNITGHFFQSGAKKSNTLLCCDHWE